MNIVAHELDLLPKVRELYSRHPEARYLEPWELQHLLSRSATAMASSRRPR